MWGKHLKEMMTWTFTVNWEKNKNTGYEELKSSVLWIGKILKDLLGHLHYSEVGLK